MPDLQNIDKTILEEIKRLQQTFDALGVPMPPIPERQSYHSNKAYEICLKVWCRSTSEKLNKNLNGSCNLDVIEDPAQERQSESKRRLLSQAGSNVIKAFGLAFKNVFMGKRPTIGDIVLAVIAIILIISFFAGIGRIFSSIYSCTNNADTSTPSYLLNGNIDNDYINDDDDVYVCTGEYSKKFHKSIHCEGLENCSGSIEKITAYEAHDCWYSPCGYCYNQSTIDNWSEHVQEIEEGSKE